MPDSEVSAAVSGLNAGRKYSLLTNHYRPGQNFMFPKTSVMGDSMHPTCDLV